MALGTVSCPACAAKLPDETLLAELPALPAPCPTCHRALIPLVFPAMVRESPSSRPGELVLESTENTCFYHAQRKAAALCDSCGRFLCALCDLELNGQHLCPSCLESGKKKGKLRSLENERTLHDAIALALAVLPILFWPLTLITAPASIYYSIRHWKSPGSVLRRTKVRFILAIIFGVLLTGGWLALFAYLLYGRHR